jgi:hypothetical protein
LRWEDPPSQTEQTEGGAPAERKFQLVAEMGRCSAVPYGEGE